MSPRLLLLSLLLLSPAAFAADAKVSKTAKAKSWKDLVAHVMKKGASRSLKGKLPVALGLGEENKTKALHVSYRDAADKTGHQIDIVLDADGKPTDVVLNETKVTEADGKKLIEGFIQRFDASGKLLQAVRSGGEVGATTLNKVELDEKTRASSQASLDYYLKMKDFSALSDK